MILVSYSRLGLWQGLPTPEPVTTSAVCQNALVSASSTLMSCTFGSISYTQVVNNYLSPWELFNDALSHDVGVLASVVVIPIFLLLIPVLYSLRRHGAIVPLVCAYLGSRLLNRLFCYPSQPIQVLLPAHTRAFAHGCGQQEDARGFNVCTSACHDNRFFLVSGTCSTPNHSHNGGVAGRFSETRRTKFIPDFQQTFSPQGVWCLITGSRRFR